VFLENDFHSDATSGAPSYTRVFFEPRLATRFTLLPERLFFVGALGAYHQAPQGAELSPRFGNPYLQWQTGTTYTLGFESNFAQGLHLSAQGFYKDLRNLVVSDVEKNFDNDGLGRVYGGELLLRQAPWRGLSGWVAYTLSRSERRDHPGQGYRPFDFDQTHILTALGSYKITRKWQVGLRYRFVTGNPSTPVVRAYYDPNDDLYRPVYGVTNSTRLPPFHALDLRVDRYFIWDRFLLDLYLDVQNVTSRANAEGSVHNFDYSRQGFVTGLPILPILGLRGQF
jgi:hypothetical protein